jgi:hypothetical protein
MCPGATPDMRRRCSPAILVVDPGVTSHSDASVKRTAADRGAFPMVEGFHEQDPVFFLQKSLFHAQPPHKAG